MSNVRYRVNRLRLRFRDYGIAAVLGFSGVGMALAFFISPAAQAAPATIYVSNASNSHCLSTGPGTAISPYCTVQEGVNAASSGGTVEVENGTYAEQVTIGSTKNNLTLTGGGSSTTIKAPSTMTTSKAIIEISGATGVTVQDLTISGPGASGCDSLEYGVKVDNGAKATIDYNHITKIEDSPFSGCPNGVAILVGHASESTNGTVVINGNTIDNYQKDGVGVSNTGSSATITNNSITGVGPTAIIAQNGIEITDGAKASLSDNTVKNNQYSPQTVSATDILLYTPGTVTLKDNVTSKGDVDIYLQGVAKSSFTDNVATDATFKGIYADPTSTGNSFTDNAASGTKTGIGNYDMEDDSTGTGTLKTANTWHNNGCKTSLPAMLCLQ